MLDGDSCDAACSVTNSGKDVESNKGAAFESDDSIDPGSIKACCSVQSLPV